MIDRHHNTLIMNLNFLGVAVAYGLLGMSLWLSTDVPLATKGYWGMGILLLTLSLINVVKYRFDMRFSDDRLRKIEDAKNEKLLEEALKEEV
ncbi:YiaA/YiaB family inner membrane protein [Gymnodinialimonas sp.]